MKSQRSVMPLLCLLLLGSISGCGLFRKRNHSTTPPTRPEVSSKLTFGPQQIDIDEFFSSSGFGLTFFVNPEDNSMFRHDITSSTSVILRHSLTGNLWDPKSGELFSEFGRRAFSSPKYDPQTKKLFFISDVTNNETYNVYSLDPISRKIEQITALGFANAFTLIPEKKVLVIGRERKLGPDPVTCLWERGVESSATTITNLYCDDQDPKNAIYAYSAPLLSEDNKKIAFVRLLEKKYEQQQIMLFDRDSKNATSVTPAFNDIQLVSWKGNLIFYMANNGMQTSLYVYNLETLTNEVVFKNQDKWAGKAVALAEKDKILVEFSLPQEKKATLYFYDAAARKIVTEVSSYETGINFRSGPQVMKDGSYVFSFKSPTSLEQGAVQIRADIGAKTLELNKLYSSTAKAATASACASEEVYYQTFDSRKTAEKTGDVWKAVERPRKIHAVLFKPTYQATKTQKAALVFAHGGPGGRSTSSWYPDIQVLCHLGYTVIAPNPRGSSGGGESDVELDGSGNVKLGLDGNPVYGNFQGMNDLDWGGGDYNDYEMAMKYLAETQGIPQSRIGIYGFSYGGYMTNWAVTRPQEGRVYQKFNFGISMAGVSDLLNFLSGSVVPIAVTGEMGNPVANKALYENRSPSHFVQNVDIPVLIMHGSQDNRINVSESRDFYAAIKGARPEADITFLEHQDEGHGNQYRDNNCEKFKTMLDFLWRIAPVE